MKESWLAILIAIVLGGISLYVLITFIGFILEHPNTAAGLSVAAAAAGSFFLSKKK